MKLMKLFLSLFLTFFLITSAEAATYYVDDTGGSDTTNCTGLADAAYDGSGTGEACRLAHPAWAIGATGTSTIMSGGDTLIINEGEYLIGYGMPNTSGCSAAAAYDCKLDPIVAGASGANKTKIYGAGYLSQTGTRPKLYGVERTDVFDLSNDNVDVRWLDITDASTCIENGPSDGTVDGFPVKCERDASPFGNWASIGIYSDTATGIDLTDVNVYGLAKKGIFAYHAGNWTLTRTNIVGNAFVGWDSDGTGDDSYTGTITFTNSMIEHSGCGMRYPLQSATLNDVSNIHHCWSQDQGGFGDGIGLGDGDPGNWTFINSSVSHNVSDGVDLLHGSGTGTIIFYGSKAEGNAGQQLKTSVATTYIENSKIIGNCGYFHGQSFTSTKDGSGSTVSFNNCRANGDTISFSNLVGGQKIYLFNSTVLSNGNIVLLSGGSNCDGSTLFKVDNSIIYGGRERNDDTTYNGGGGDDTSDLYYAGGSDGNGAGACGSLAVDIDNSIVYNTKSIGSDTDCSGGTNNSCNVDPQFTGTILQGPASGDGYYTSPDYEDQIYIGVASPAINDASEAITCNGDCTVDYNDFARGASWDIGALEYGSTPPSGTCGDNTIDVGETCDGSDLDSETCVSQGFASGTLSCAGDCLSFVTSSCVAGGSGGPVNRVTGSLRVTGTHRFQ